MAGIQMTALNTPDDHFGMALNLWGIPRRAAESGGYPTMLTYKEGLAYLLWLISAVAIIYGITDIEHNLRISLMVSILSSIAGATLYVTAKMDRILFVVQQRALDTVLDSMERHR